MSNQKFYIFNENENCISIIELKFYPKNESYENAKRHQDAETFYDDEHNLIINIENSPKLTKEEILKIIKDNCNNNSKQHIKIYDVF